MQLLQNTPARSPFRNPLVVATCLIALPVSGAVAQYVDVLPHRYEPFDFRSGAFDGDDDTRQLVLSETIEIPNVPWMRIHFGDWNLGEESYITIASYRDGGWQRLDASSLPDWHNASAYFNGGMVEIELHVGPADRDVYFTIAEVEIGEYEEGGEPDDGGIASLCGADNRVASSNAATGRLFLMGGCTAWLISNGGVLTAGHCVDSDPDGNGPLLPDGVLQNGFINGIVGFNVPASANNGAPVAPDPNDQYPVSLNYVAWQFAGVNNNFNSIGADWCIFTLAPNSNTGLRAHIAQNAFYRLSQTIPSPGNTIRITGYGIDNTPAGSGGAGAPCCDSDGDGNCEFNCNSASLTLQTSTGPYSEYTEDGAKKIHKYAVDTMGANSGSPVILTSTGRAIGIHTNAGCTNSGGANAGISFQNTTLANFTNWFQGQQAVHADATNTCVAPFFCSGTVFNPHQTLAQAHSGVPNNGVIVLIQSTFPASVAGNVTTLGGTGKAMTLIAPVGTVTIGS